MTDINERIVRANCLRLACGDVSVALDIACREIDHLLNDTSAGYRREKPVKPVPAKKKNPDAVLIEGEE